MERFVKLIHTVYIIFQQLPNLLESILLICHALMDKYSHVIIFQI